MSQGSSSESDGEGGEDGVTAKAFLKKKPEVAPEASKFLKPAKGSGVRGHCGLLDVVVRREARNLPEKTKCLYSKANVQSVSLWQDESSSSDDDDDDEDWGSDTVDSGSESSDDGEGRSASLAVVFLKKWVSFFSFYY